MTRTFKGVIFAAIIILAAHACKKISVTDIGSGLIPAVDNVNTFEALLEVETDNIIFNDTSKLYNSIQGVGIIEDDPEFGRTEATMHFTMGPNGGFYPFGGADTIYIDSLVLSLSLNGIYGDSLAITNFEVREIDPMIIFRHDSAYNVVGSDFQTIPDPLGSKTLSHYFLNDSISYVNGKDTVSTIGMLRIPLDTNLARRFINYDTSNAYKSDSAFRMYFNGFQVKASPSSPSKRGIAYFNLGDEDSKLSFHVRTVNNGVTDTVTYVFNTKETPRANIIARTPANNYLSYATNNTPDDDLLFIQSTPGSYGEIKIKGLDTFSNNVIHLAELIMKPVPSAGDSWLNKPAILFLDCINETGDTAFTVRNDFVQTSQAPYYDVSSLGGELKNNRYAFNISRYIQSVVTKGQPYYTMRVYSPSYTQPFFMDPNGTISTTREYIPLYNQLGAGRVVLGGGSHTDQKMVLRIIYSKL